MKIKKYLLALLLSSSAFLMTGSLGAEIVMSAEAALAAASAENSAPGLVFILIPIVSLHLT